MAMPAAQDRDAAAQQFWKDVEELLGPGGYGRDPQQVQNGIQAYRNATWKQEERGMVYNQGEERTARIINDVIGNRYQVPRPS